MDLRERSRRFMVEFVALCERYGAGVVTEKGEPVVLFLSREDLARYVCWVEGHTLFLEKEGFEDFLK